MTNENIYSDIITGIITTLRANITDPDTARSGAGKQFIYPDLPFLSASMPRISITLIPAGESENIDLGSNTQQIIQILQIDIWCAVKGNFTISSVKYGNTKLRDYLAGQVVKVLQTNRHSLLTTYNIIDIIQHRPFGAMAAGDKQLTRSMAEYEIIYHQTYT